MIITIEAIDLGLNKKQPRTVKSAIYRFLVAKGLLANRFGEFSKACREASVQLAKFGKQIERVPKKATD